MALIAEILEYKVSTTRELFDAESGWRDASGILNVSSIHSNFFQERMIRGARAFSFFKIGISGH